MVLESSDGLRTNGSALTLWTNAWRALDALGVGHHLRELSLQLKGGSVNSIYNYLKVIELTQESY